MASSIPLSYITWITWTWINSSPSFYLLFKKYLIFCQSYKKKKNRFLIYHLIDSQYYIIIKIEIRQAYLDIKWINKSMQSRIINGNNTISSPFNTQKSIWIRNLYIPESSLELTDWSFPYMKSYLFSNIKLAFKNS